MHALSINSKNNPELSELSPALRIALAVCLMSLNFIAEISYDKILRINENEFMSMK